MNRIGKSRSRTSRRRRKRHVYVCAYINFQNYISKHYLMSPRLPNCMYVRMCVYVCMCLWAHNWTLPLLPTLHSCCRKRHNLLFCQCEWAEIAVSSADLHPSPPPSMDLQLIRSRTATTYTFIYNCIMFLFSYSYCTSVPMGVVMSWRQWPWIKCWYARPHAKNPLPHQRQSGKAAYAYVLATAARQLYKCIMLASSKRTPPPWSFSAFFLTST